MPLPRHATALVEHWHGAEQDAAVNQQHDQPDDDVPKPAHEYPENQQESQPAEDQAGGPDVVGGTAAAAHVADEPGAKAAQDPHDRGGPDEPGQSGQCHQKPQHQQRDRIGHQVLPAGMQNRRKDDPPQAVGCVRPDPIGIELAAHQLVNELDEIQQRHEGEDRGTAHHPPGSFFRLCCWPLALMSGRPGHAHSCPSRAFSASSRLPA
jgi:hypothetical protein